VADSKGHYPKLQFKAGGNANKPNQSSFEVENDFVTLTPEWRQYTIDIRGKNLSKVVSAFTWAINAEDNPNGAIFYLSEIMYQ
jgi:hypothetical protein